VINHLRTLLLNQDGNLTVDPDTPGEEYVPPRYRAVPLAPALLPLRTLLFGVNPDRVFLNARLRQYLTVLAVCRMDAVEDERKTYRDCGGDNLYDAVAPGPSYQQTGGTPGAWIQLVQAGFARAENRLSRSWSFEVVDSDTARVEWLDDSGQLQRQDLEYSTDNGTGVLLLPGMPLTACFAPATGNAWRVQLTARPLPDLATLVEQAPRLVAQGPARSLLFENQPDLLAVLDGHPVLLHRLAAVLRALALWIDARRGGNT
jgi:hypothetical protein